MSMPTGTQKIRYGFANPSHSFRIEVVNFDTISPSLIDGAGEAAADAAKSYLEANGFASEGANYSRSYEVIEVDSSWPT